MEQVFEALGRVGLVPVISLPRAEDAVPVARALIEGGLPVAEITFRTAAAPEAIRRLAGECQEMILGAGTVLTIAQAEQALEAGVRYIVAPGFDPRLVEWCAKHGMPILPGVATPTEITMALGAGLSVLKFFPAEENGGTRMLRALGGPFGEVRFVPTGGITAENLGDYLRLPNVIAVGGSWMVSKALIAAGDHKEIARLAAEARRIVASTRGKG